ncbi:hypothetical protein QDX21_03360 [Auritidibacter ignavus]|uniref:Uncharacterized protein n=1 Tax=Auritidibacter ignavus TaxID=678932 RepID=A0AAJ6AQ98_9MICC|nr:hypothetical protein [Auritidibacter ignavus]WGH91425.1 hypothetical protein QDX23_03400 [Auritidibacter ignavus]WGH93849.1 hypothetical protein QDX21_03360 [Auritidibacter ignavus]
MTDTIQYQFNHLFDLALEARHRTEELMDTYEHIIGDYLFEITLSLESLHPRAGMVLKLDAYPNMEAITGEALDWSTDNTPELASRFALRSEHVDEFIEELFSNVLKINQKLYEHRHGATND